MITLINAGCKYEYPTISQAAWAARTRPQVQQILDQGQSELREKFGVYTWTIQEVWARNSKGKLARKYFIQAQWKSDTFHDSEEVKTPGEALRNFLNLR